jgi:hypothetical protein
MKTLAPLEARGKSEPFATPSSIGSDHAHWRRYWVVESARVRRDWKTLLTAADAVLSRLRAAHVMVGAPSP